MTTTAKKHGKAIQPSTATPIHAVKFINVIGSGRLRE
jgi:hypothetical protein